MHLSHPEGLDLRQRQLLVSCDVDIGKLTLGRF